MWVLRGVVGRLTPTVSSVHVFQYVVTRTAPACTLVLLSTIYVWATTPTTDG